MGSYDGHGFREYVPVAARKAKARRKLEQLRKKYPNIRPVVVEGAALARTWWGKAWNANLTKYADYANRVGRGRSYVRHGAVLDLQIKRGQVNGLVQGSRSTPYDVSIQIDPIGRTAWTRITAACGGQLGSLEALLAGQFPKALADLFTAKGQGLFPTPKEIHLRCSCPDWASMCKHVAAVLYGIGTRLDQDPQLFFILRQVEIDDMIARSVRTESERLLKQARKKTSRVIGDSDLAEVFGIDVDTAAGETAEPTPPGTKAEQVPKTRRKPPPKRNKGTCPTTNEARKKNRVRGKTKKKKK